MHYKLLKKDLPAAYELSWESDPPQIKIAIHKTLAYNFDKILNENTPLVKGFMDNFKFKSFSSNLENNFGFEGVTDYISTKNEFVKIRIIIPAFEKFTDKDCFSCQGTGIHSFSDDKCPSCEGYGKESKIDWHKAYAISATINLISSIIDYLCNNMEEKNIQLDTDRKQLLSLRCVTEANSHGGSLDGVYSITLLKWLKNNFQEEERIPIMEAAMNHCQNHVSIHKNRFDITAYLAKGNGVSMNMPFGGVCIYCEHKELLNKRAIDFCSHNVDTPIQQLIFITGLAALYEHAKKNIYNLSTES